MNKKIILIVMLFLVAVAISSYWFGSHSMAVEVDDQVLTYNEFTEKTREINIEYNSAIEDLKIVYDEIDRIQEEIDSKLDVLTEALEVRDQQEELEQRVEVLNNQIKEKELLIDELDTKIIALREAPIILSAGHYIVGSDLPPGRYVAEANGGRGNFFVRADGRSKVAVTLGDRDSHESEYIFFAENGDTMELDTATKFTEIE